MRVRRKAVKLSKDHTRSIEAKRENPNSPKSRNTRQPQNSLHETQSRLFMEYEAKSPKMLVVNEFGL